MSLHPGSNIGSSFVAPQREGQFQGPTGRDRVMINEFDDQTFRAIGGPFGVPPERTDPYADLDAFYRGVIDEGIFGKEGIDDIMTTIRGARQRATSRLAGGLRKRAARRLGTRSGVVDQVAANVFGGAISGEQRITAELNQANILSKFQGIQGLFDLQRLRDQRERFDISIGEERRQFDIGQEGGGFSAWDLAELGFRAWAAATTGGASEVALAATNVGSRNQIGSFSGGGRGEIDEIPEF